MENQIYNRQEMEERMPDYIFGRLPKDELDIFENSLKFYPDLQDEVREVRLVFSKLERMQLDSFLEKKTRNIPVKVSSKLQQKRNPLNIFARPAFVTLVAGLGVLLIAISIFLSYKDKHTLPQVVDKKEVSVNIQQPLFPQLDELNALAEKEPVDRTNYLEFGLTPFVDYSTLYEPIAEDLDDLVSEELVNLVSSNSKVSLNLIDSRFINELENLDENDFQTLMEELKNVKI